MLAGWRSVRYLTKGVSLRVINLAREGGRSSLLTRLLQLVAPYKQQSISHMHASDSYIIIHLPTSSKNGSTSREHQAVSLPPFCRTEASTTALYRAKSLTSNPH